MSVTWDNLWTIDCLVAAGTLALAVSTLILAFFTLYTARKTKQLAVTGRDEVLAVKEQATISRNALQATVRPLMVGIPPDLPQFAQTEVVDYPMYGHPLCPSRTEARSSWRSQAPKCSCPFRSGTLGTVWHYR